MNRLLGAFTILGLCAFPLTACKSKPPLSPTAPDWLPTVVEDQAKENAPEAERVGEIFKGVAQKEDGSKSWQMTLDPKNCYWFSAAGDEGVEELYLNLWDPEDDRVAKQKEQGPKTILAYCPETSGMFKLEAKVTEGRGHFQVGVYAKDAPERKVVTEPEPAAEPVPQGPDLEKIIADMAASSAPGAERVGNFFSGAADKTDWFAQMETGKCYWLIGAGDDGISELYLYLWDPKDDRVAQNKAESNRSTVGHCPTSSGMYKFQAKVSSGSGNYKVGVYAKDK